METETVLDVRLDELLQRMVAPGPFPNMSASEGHELVDMVYELVEDYENCRKELVRLRDKNNELLVQAGVIMGGGDGD